MFLFTLTQPTQTLSISHRVKGVHSFKVVQLVVVTGIIFFHWNIAQESCNCSHTHTQIQMHTGSEIIEPLALERQA